MIRNLHTESKFHHAAESCGTRVRWDGTSPSKSGRGDTSRRARWLDGRRAGLAGVLLLWSAAAQAVPIVSVTGSGQPTGFLIGTAPGGEQILAVSWTATESYTDVAITALLSGTFRGFAHLTTAVGPGTTAAAEVALGFLDVDLSTDDRADVSLFSGLALAPATYFLLLETTGGSGNWWSEPFNVIVLDTGVSLNNSIRSNDTDIDPSFAPASSFSLVNNGFPFSFAVTGERSESIPEPASGLMIAGGLALLAWAGRRRLRRMSSPES